jgi:hypothetical protein
MGIILLKIISMECIQSYLLNILITTLFSSCIKEDFHNDSSCKRDCQRVRLSGQVLDLSLNTGIRNTEVKASFSQFKSNCFICFGIPIETNATTTTDNIGRFSFDIIVDTIALNGNYHYSLNVYAIANDLYIPGNNKTFYNYPDSFSNIILTKYKKATLTVDFKRDSVDIFNQYDVRQIFRGTYNNKEIEPPWRVCLYQSLKYEYCR